MGCDAVKTMQAMKRDQWVIASRDPRQLVGSLHVSVRQIGVLRGGKPTKPDRGLHKLTSISENSTLTACQLSDGP